MNLPGGRQGSAPPRKVVSFAYGGDIILSLRCREDEYDEAVESLMSLGGAMLRVGGSNLLQYFSSPSSPSIPGTVGVNKIGVAATEDTSLSQEEILHRLQVSRR